jgi:hypothetical protein
MLEVGSANGGQVLARLRRVGCSIPNREYLFCPVNVCQHAAVGFL